MEGDIKRGRTSTKQMHSLIDKAMRNRICSLKYRSDHKLDRKKVCFIWDGSFANRLGMTAPKVIKEASKRKPGRPPGKRTVQGSSKLIRGSTSKKKKTHQDKPTATRRKLNQDSAQGSPQKSKSKPSSSRGSRGVNLEVLKDRNFKSSGI
ncbi:hypothetical protein YC2023_077193 [Brassica napus]